MVTWHDQVHSCLLEMVGRAKLNIFKSLTFAKSLISVGENPSDSVNIYTYECSPTSICTIKSVASSSTYASPNSNW